MSAPNKLLPGYPPWKQKGCPWGTQEPESPEVPEEVPEEARTEAQMEVRREALKEVQKGDRTEGQEGLKGDRTVRDT